MSLYGILCKISQNPQKIKGGGFSDLLTFDLKNKDIRSKHFFIMKNGKVTCKSIQMEDGTTYDLADIELLSQKEIENDDQFLHIQDLYNDYLYSRPSSHANFANSNFRCKKSDELTFDQLLNGKARNEARYRLEAYILLGSVSKIFLWPNPEYWFWKGTQGLVLYRDWIL